MRALFATAIAAGLLWASPASAQFKLNTAPLVLGMTADDAAAALAAPLYYVAGRPGEETLLALRHQGGSGFFAREDRLYLQFRRGRLTGFRGVWGRNWLGF